jgi:tetratricopeptide (TPR) repeat protein
MAHDFARVAQVWGTVAAGEHDLGSGYLVSPRFVLTAGHVLDRLVEGPWVRFLPGSPLRPAAVVWRGRDGVDAALLRLDAPAEPVRPVRWGRLTGSEPGVPVVLMGFPRAQRWASGERDSGQDTGRINPGSGRLHGHYEITLDVPPAKVPSPWAGLSGAAAFCGDLLTAVVVTDTGGKLTAVPAARLCDDAGFRAAVEADAGPLVPESVELVHLLSAPQRWPDVRSPSFLLRADVEAVRFRGRREVLERLLAWCRGDGFGVRLLTGSGGQGKTRLARRLMDHLRADGWAAGWLLDRDFREQALRPVTTMTVPLLLVVDYAETRPASAYRLIETALSGTAPAPVRVLIVARSAGDWWTQFQRRTGELSNALADTPVDVLPPLEDTQAGRIEAFGEAATDLAQRLGEVPGYETVTWAEHLPAVKPPDLTGPGAGSALALQMAALSCLLQTGPRPVPSAPGRRAEDLLLDHEVRYWERAAAARWPVPFTPRTLREAVVCATLYGAATEDEAQRVIARLPALADQTYDVRRAVCSWLHDLYPASAGNFWGPLEPDRLGEYLVEEAVGQSPDVIGAILPHVSQTQTHRALTVLARISGRQPAVLDILADLVARAPHRFAGPVIDVAAQTNQPIALLTVVGKLTDASALPAGILEQAQTGTRLGAPSPVLVDALVAVCDRCREFLPADPDRYLPMLATSLNLLAFHLGEVRRHGEALTAADEAVQHHRVLARQWPDEHLAGLASALLNRAVRLGDQGLVDEAVDVVSEAVTCYRTLADRQPDTHLPALAAALNSLSVRLGEVGSHEAALTAVEEAVAVFRALSDDRPDLHLPGLASSLSNLGSQLAAIGEADAALAAVDESIGQYRAVRGAGAAAARPGLARAVASRAERLAELGRHAEAFDAIREAIGRWEHLGADLPLADTLVTYARMLIQVRRPAAAAGPLVRAFGLSSRQLDASRAARAAEVLINVYRRDPEGVSAAWWAATGFAPPDWLRGTGDYAPWLPYGWRG